MYLNRPPSFRITSPLRGLKLCSFFIEDMSIIIFRITSPLRGLRNNISLLPRSRYLCINSAPHYLCLPLRGLQNSVSLFLKSRYPCVNGTPYHLRPPLRGLKHCCWHCRSRSQPFRITSPLRGLAE